MNDSDEQLIAAWRDRLPEGANDRKMGFFFATCSDEICHALTTNPDLLEKVEKQQSLGKLFDLKRKGDAAVLSIGPVVVASFSRHVLFENGPQVETR